MGRRLKQIKKADLGEFGKQVIDSLISSKKTDHKEHEKESMRCKVDIFEGSTKPILTDSFVINTDYLEDTISDIISKYGKNVQFSITNLFNEKIVAKRFVHTNGMSKEKMDREHFNRRMESVKQVHKMRDEGISIEDICNKLSYIATRQYLRDIYVNTEEDIVQSLRNDYGNQSLGKYQDIPKDLNITKPNMSVDKEENINSGDNNEE